MFRVSWLGGGAVALAAFVAACTGEEPVRVAGSLFDTSPGTGQDGSVAPKDVPEEEDVAPDEGTAPPDLFEEPDAGPLPGSIGWTCESNDDCLDGWCITTANGLACTELCVSSCPDGWTCKQVTAQGGSDPAYVCVPLYVHL